MRRQDLLSFFFHLVANDTGPRVEEIGNKKDTYNSEAFPGQGIKTDRHITFFLRQATIYGLLLLHSRDITKFHNAKARGMVILRTGGQKKRDNPLFINFLLANY